VLPETTPIISGFEYVSGNVQRMYAANATKLYDVTTTTPTLIKIGQASGNYCASQLANASGDYMMVVNDAGDYPLRFDGTTWTTLNAGQITGPAGSTVVAGTTSPTSEVSQPVVLHRGRLDECVVPAAQREPGRAR
jgi:hypothetical protein